MRPLDETRERFLAAIAQQIFSTGAPDQAPPDGEVAVIEEVQVFPPIRQGAAESGVAVVAVSLPRKLTPDAIGDAGAAQPVHPHANRAAEHEQSRKVIYTARYKLTLKGPDRGRWEFTMHPDADAPLPTVDKVVRGVQQRSGFAEEAARLSGDEVRAALDARSRAAQASRQTGLGSTG
jgi:hypothetical protein